MVAVSRQLPRPRRSATPDGRSGLLACANQIADPALQEWVRQPAVHFWVGPGSHAIGYSLRAGRQYNIVLLVPDTLPTGVSQQPGSTEEMKALFEGWDPTLSRFLDMVDSVDKWRLISRFSVFLVHAEKGNGIHCFWECSPR